MKIAMKKNLCSISAVLIALFVLLPNTQAGPDSTIKVFSAVSPDAPHALVLAAGPQATFSKNGAPFEKLKKGQALTEGSVVRTGDKTVIDLFIRRWGTTVRVTPNTELAFEKLSISSDTNAPSMETSLNLSAGRIFCFLRAPVANGKLEIQTPQGRSQINSASAGRYDIRADGTVVAGKSSFNQVRLLTENGETIVAPGQSFSGKDGIAAPVAPSDAEMLVIEMDQLAALAQKLAVRENPPKTD
jgi:hypothetical protein